MQKCQLWLHDRLCFSPHLIYHFVRDRMIELAQEGQLEVALYLLETKLWFGRPGVKKVKSRKRRKKATDDKASAPDDKRDDPAGEGSAPDEKAGMTLDEFIKESAGAQDEGAGAAQSGEDPSIEPDAPSGDFDETVASKKPPRRKKAPNAVTKDETKPGKGSGKKKKGEGKKNVVLLQLTLLAIFGPRGLKGMAKHCI
jgi:hypothetical protein